MGQGAKGKGQRRRPGILPGGSRGQGAMRKEESFEFRVSSFESLVEIKERKKG